jgi:hypothetical protein
MLAQVPECTDMLAQVPEREFDAAYCLTPRGRYFVEYICALPYPTVRFEIKTETTE